MSDTLGGLEYGRLLAAARDLDAELDKVLGAYERLHDALALAMPCPRCGAAPGEACRTSTGGPVRTWSKCHVGRWETARRIAWPEEGDGERR